MPKKEAFGRLAKRRKKLLVLAGRYLDEGDFDTSAHYIAMAAEIEARLRAAKVCIACGRPIKNPDSLESGFGPECTAKLEEESTC